MRSAHLEERTGTMRDESGPIVPSPYADLLAQHIADVRAAFRVNIKVAIRELELHPLTRLALFTLMGVADEDDELNRPQMKSGREVRLP